MMRDTKGENQANFHINLKLSHSIELYAVFSVCRLHFISLKIEIVVSMHRVCAANGTRKRIKSTAQRKKVGKKMRKTKQINKVLQISFSIDADRCVFPLIVLFSLYNSCCCCLFLLIYKKSSRGFLL